MKFEEALILTSENDIFIPANSCLEQTIAYNLCEGVSNQGKEKAQRAMQTKEMAGQSVKIRKFLIKKNFCKKEQNILNFCRY